MSPRCLLPIGLAVLAIGLAACTATPDTAAPEASTVGPTATASTSPATGAADSCRRQVEAMGRAERAGQLVMVGHQVGEDPAATGRLVEEHGLGSVILMGNSEAGVDGIRATTEALREAGDQDTAGLLIAVDQEGGQVRRLSGEGFTPMPSATEQARLAPEELTATARTWGTELRAACIDVTLAPVADVVPGDRADVNEPVARWGRGFGSDADAVATRVAAFVTGMRGGGTGTAVKHFPGLGQVVGNTDFATGVTDDRTVRHDPLLAPFAAGIEAGTDMVMVSLARYSRIDPDRPASWSPVVIEDMLRGDLGWQGVVVSDDLGVAEQVQDVDPAERAVRFVAAGGDIAITVDPALADEMAAGLVAAAEADPALDTRVHAAAERVLELKAARGLAACRPD